MPRGGDVQHEYGDLLEPDRVERDDLQRRQRVHPDRRVPDRGVHGVEPGDMHRERSMPYGGYVQHVDGRVLQSHRVERDDVQRRERVHAD